VPIPVNAKPFANVPSNSGEFPNAGYLSGGPSADRFQASPDKVGVALVTVCSKKVQHRCETVSGCCDVRIQNPSCALNLRINAGGGHLD